MAEIAAPRMRSAVGSQRHSLAPGVARAAQPLPEPQRGAIRQSAVHLHVHGISAEDLAAVLPRETLPGLDVNRPGPPSAL